MNMMKKVLFGVVAAAAACFALASEARAQAPRGSYQQSCSVKSVDTKTQKMSAECRAKSGATMMNANWSYKNCVGDIWNGDGVLGCKKKPENKETSSATKQETSGGVPSSFEDFHPRLMETARKNKPAYDIAAIEILGRPGKDLQEIADWLWAAGGNGFQEGDALNAMEALKAMLANSGAMRRELIDRAFQEVYGRDSRPGELALWDEEVKAKRASYKPILKGEYAKLQSSQTIRRQAMLNAFLNATGRLPNADEEKRWIAVEGYYSTFLRSMRDWLWTPGAAAERTATIERALKKKTGQQPTADEIKNAIPGFSESRKIYAEMIK